MQFVIQGGGALRGSVSIRGAKNAATKALIASLLTRDPVTLRNVPFIGDVAITQELCESFGSVITEDRHNGSVRIHTPSITNTKALNLSRRNRLPILALGPLLARAGEAVVPIVGGDKIGPRPVDLHIKALEALGARVEEFPDRFEARAPQGLKGAYIKFPFPSVGATENTLLASVLARGATTIENAAIEPEVIDLIQLLQKMGAIIGLGANRMVYVEGVGALHGADHTLLPDRNEAISFAVLGVVTNGAVKLEGVNQQDLITFLNTIRKVGGGYDVRDNAITFFRERPLKAVAVETDTHPGFMTDWQQPLAVLLTQAEGRSIIHETIYEDRFAYTNDLIAMGADIEVVQQCLGQVPCRFFDKEFHHSAVIKGPTSLKGGTMKVRDLRSGMAHVIAALVAQGESVIDGVEEIDRGYEQLDKRLIALGASIQRREQ